MRVVIVGSTGYGGLELIRLCEAHPQLEIGALVSTSVAGEALGDVFPHLRPLELPFTPLSVEAIATAGEVVFFATPAGVSSEWVPQLLSRGLICIDLSGDFRLPDGEMYREWYGRETATDDELARAVYGLSEWERTAVREAQLVANPGCYPTATLLALLPLLQQKFIVPETVVIDAKSGVSGAGRTAQLPLLFTEVNDNLRPYKVDRHQHIPEIEHTCQRVTGESLNVSFTPHLIPMSRGICCTVYASLVSGTTPSDIRDVYRDRYGTEPFVRLRPQGEWPQTKDVTGSNYCDIAFQVDQRTGRVIVFSVIDNLIKGAAGQAVQNLNIRMGWPETMGLSSSPLYV